MRLGKHLAHAGVASRRASEALIAEGRVTIAGEVVRDPARDVDDGDPIAVDGRLVKGFEAPVVYAVNKPVGVLSTASDPHARPTVVGLLARERRRLYPVGRLDLDSEGLILLTNDGELAHALTHPSFEVPKTYRVSVSGGRVSEATLRALREGVRLDDGMTAPAEVERVRSGAARGGAVEELKITIREGRNRQVRRMLDTVGHPVKRLIRVRFGPLALGRLPSGGHRLLSEAEVSALRDAARGTRPRATAR
jgi:23S rRNA pseudouridine2605 synthase